MKNSITKNFYKIIKFTFTVNFLTSGKFLASFGCAFYCC